jgi:hypothetical protein
MGWRLRVAASQSVSTPQLVEDSALGAEFAADTPWTSGEFKV